MWQDTSVFIQNAESKAPGWHKRAEVLAREIKKTATSFVAFQELYQKQLAHMDSLLLPHYKRAAYKNGRVLYYRADRWKPVGIALWKNMQAGNTKPAVGRKFERLENGARINLINVHLSFEVTKKGSLKRKAETYNILDWALKKFPKDRRVYVGDWNTPAGSTTRPDDVGPIMKRHGYHDIGLAAKPKTGRGNYHLDRAFGSDAATKPLEVRVVKHGASDHPGVFMKFSFKKK